MQEGNTDLLSNALNTQRYHEASSVNKFPAIRRFTGFLKRALDKLLASRISNLEEYERKIIRKQKGIYRMKPHFFHGYGYEMSELDPPYEYLILDPFIKRLKMKPVIP